MKQVLQLVSFLCLSSSFLCAQSPERSNNEIKGQQTSDNKAKQDYIREQHYLSENSLYNPGSFNSDSLQGFDEEAMRPELLKRGVYGAEYQNFIAHQKRAYIKHKYKLDVQKSQPALSFPAPASGGKNIGGGATINLAPCVNEDFEQSPVGQHTSSTSILGWTVESGQNSTQIFSPNTSYGAACNSNATNNWSPGSPELWVVTTPVTQNFIGTIPNSPLGGTKILQIQNTNPTGLMTRIKTTFPVTAQNTLFQYAYAGSWDGVHECCGQPAFRIDMYESNCTTGQPTLMPCSNVSLTPSGPQCVSGVPGYQTTGTVSWTNWVVKTMDLTPYIGKCVTIVVTTADCSYTGHHGTAYFDAMCGGQLTGPIPPTGPTNTLAGNPAVSFCAGANQAVISGPLGYATYSWVAPPPLPTIPASLATLPTLTITNPMAGAVYTLYLTTASGCQYVTTNTLTFSQVNIAAIQGGTTCPGGANGTATVIGNGSGTGYNYTWLNSANAVVGTSAVATGLAAGVYSVMLTGVGSAGCGTAVATATVTNGTPGVVSLTRPYCGSTAYLNMPGGSQYQWYTGNTPVPNNNTSSLTISSPNPSTPYWLSYMINGCKDSVLFQIYPAPVPQVSVTNISLICQGGSNGTALVSMTPAVGATSLLHSYTVASTGITAPYNSTSAVTSSTIYPVNSLSAGTYTVRAFDGSCYGSASFNVVPFNYTFNVTPVTTPTLCPGNGAAVAVNFPMQFNTSQFNYLWLPDLYFPGPNSNIYSSSIITPVLSPGTQTTITYTVVVTPKAVNCPLSATLDITAVNPATPTISSVPVLCDNLSGYQINAGPPGGTFIGNSNALSSTGLITPTNANLGYNAFTYSYSIMGCGITKPDSFQVSHFNTAALSAAVPPLCVTNSPFNLMNIVQNTANGSWSGVSVASNYFNPAGLSTGNYSIKYKTVSVPNPEACPDSSSITVPVTATIVPSIAPVPEFCTSKAPFSMTVSPAGGTWSGNSLSQQGVVTPVNAQTGPVQYNITIGPCVNTATTMLNVSSFVPAALSGTIGNLCSKNPPVNLLNIVQNPNGWWSGTGVLNNLFDPANLQTGVYTSTFTSPSVPNPTLCPDINFMAIHVLNPETPQISDMGAICSKAGAIQLTVTPANGKWSATPYLTVNGLFTPSLASVGNNPVQYVIGTSTCNNQQTKQINVEAFVSAKITNKLSDLCSNGAPVNLEPLTESNAGTWTGQGINGKLFSPGVVGSGQVTLIHQTSSYPSGLCPDQDIMSVNIFSLATPEISAAGPFCNSGAPVQLIVSPVGGIFEGAHPGMISGQGKFNPGSAHIGPNVINYSITSGPCVAYAQTTVMIEKFVSADFAKQVEPFCLIPGKTFPVNMDSYVQNTGGSWSGPGVTGNMFDPYKASVGKNNVLTYYTHSSPSGLLCPDSSSVRIEVRERPVVQALSNTDKACAPAEIVFNTPSVHNGTGTWYLDNGTDPVNGLSISYTYTNPGTYYVTFSYKDDIGCEAEPVKLQKVVVHEMPKADFILPGEIYTSEPSVHLKNNSSVLSNNSYEWKLDRQLFSYEVSPSLHLGKPGRYEVTLVARTDAGCKDELSRYIEVKNDFNVFIPGSFSPNYDGLNDVFVPVFTEQGLDEKSFQMEIFNRWGHLLFLSKDKNKGWDGNFNGEPVKQDVYVYRIKFRDMDGNQIEKIGDIAVLR